MEQHGLPEAFETSLLNTEKNEWINCHVILWNHLHFADCWLCFLSFSDQRRVIINSVRNWCVFKQDRVITISNKFKLIFTLASPLFESLFPNETENVVIKSKPIGRCLRKFVLLVYKQFFQDYLQKWLQYDNLKPINCKTREKLLPCCYFCFIQKMLSGFDLAVGR